MKDTSKYLNFILSFLLLGAVSLSFVACSEMDDTYDDFIKDGMIIYPGKADSVRVFSGRERLNLMWLASADPKVEKAVVYWNNMRDSLEVPLEGYAPGKDTVTVAFTGMEEASYVFEIYTFDGEGNRSVKVEAIGQVYGDRYEQKLLSRPINTAKLEGDTLNIEWGSIPDFTAIGSEVVYEGKEGVENEVYVPASDPFSYLPDFVPGTFKHRTLYLPDSTAIDTFYTDYNYQLVKGPPILLWDKSNWSITASSEDVKGGRTAQNLIDGDLSNLYVNQLGSGLTFPHTVTVDMNETVAEVEGFYFYQRNLNPLRTLDVHISMDGENWKNLGRYIIDDSSVEPVFLQLEEPVEFRYFKQIYIDNIANKDNINIHEMGIYKRN